MGLSIIDLSQLFMIYLTILTEVNLASILVCPCFDPLEDLLASHHRVGWPYLLLLPTFLEKHSVGCGEVDRSSIEVALVPLERVSQVRKGGREVGLNRALGVASGARYLRHLGKVGDIRRGPAKFPLVAGAPRCGGFATGGVVVDVDADLDGKESDPLRVCPAIVDGVGGVEQAKVAGESGSS